VFLSKLVLDVRSRAVRRDLGNPYELHRTLSRVLEDQEGRILWRVETPQHGPPLVLVQSPEAPEWRGLERERYLRTPGEVKGFTPRFGAGQRFYFRLRANTVVTRQGKRSGLPDEAKGVWLARKAELGGFKLLGGRVLESGVVRARRGGTKVTLSVATFEGGLEVVEEERFTQALVGGIGPAKAFGMGLLSLAALGD